MRTLDAPLVFFLAVLIGGCSADAPGGGADTASGGADVDVTSARQPPPPDAAIAAPVPQKQPVFGERRALQAPLPEGLAVPVEFSVISDNTNDMGDMQQRSVSMDVYESDIDAMVARFADSIRATGYVEGGEVTTPRSDTRVASFRLGRSSISVIVVGDETGTFTEGATAVATLVFVAPKPESASTPGG